MDVRHIIEPERLGLWTAAAFILALLALVMGFYSIYRSNQLALVTQTQMLMLNKKVEASQQMAPAAPAAPAKMEEAAPEAK